MRRVQIYNSKQSIYPAPDNKSVDSYESSRQTWRNRGLKPINFEHLCCYSTLNVVIEALLADDWATVDWLNDWPNDGLRMT